MPADRRRDLRLRQPDHYFFVTSGFGNSDDGAFSNSIIGPGLVIRPGPIFADGFETGNFTWPVTQP